MYGTANSAGRSFSTALLTGICLVALSVIMPERARAGCPGVIPSGTVETTQQTLNSGDSCRVEAGGGIDVTGSPGSYGVEVFGNGAVFDNDGTVDASGIAVKLQWSSSNVRIHNRGTITSTGSDALEVDGNNHTIINEGTLKGAPFAYGLYIDHAYDSTFHNTSTGVIDGGIYVEEHGDRNTIINDGIIRDSIGDAIHFEDDLDGKTTIINNNLIYSPNSHAIHVDDDAEDDADVTIVNRGTIRSDTYSAIYIEDVDDADARFTIINSGRIIAPLTEAAIEFDIGHNRLVLLPGSLIQGQVLLGGGVDVSLRNGASTVLQVSGTLGSTFSSILPMHVDVANNRIVTVNTNELGGSALGLNMLTIGDGVASALPPLADGIFAAGPVSVRVRPAGGAVWAISVHASTFGSVRETPLTYVTVRQSAFGGLLGLDWQLDDAWRIGIFGGAATGHSRSQSSAGAGYSADTRNVFGGLTGRYSSGMYHVRATGLVGHGSDADGRRDVLNNLAPSGIETAAASLSGTYVLGQLAAAMDMPLGGGIGLLPEVRGTFGHASGDYTESGGTVPVSAKHSTDVLQGRAQMAVYWKQRIEDVVSGLVLRGGVQVDNIRAKTGSVTLAGGASLPSDRWSNTQVTGFAGGEIRIRRDGGSTFFVTGDVHFGEGGVLGFTGRVGMRIALDG